MANTLSTNLSLQTPIKESIGYSDDINLQGAHSANMAILEKAISGVQAASTTGVNATVINTNGNRIINMQLTSAGSIASITGMLTGHPFTLIFQSVGSFGMLDTGVFRLNGNINGAIVTNTALTLVWDGTNYIELGRSANT